VLAKTMALILAAALWAVGGCGNAGRKLWVAQQFGAPSHPSEEDTVAFEEAVWLAAELQYEQAAGKFAQLGLRFEKAGDRDRAAECMFWRAYCREKQGRLAEAAALYRRIPASYSETRSADRAAARLADIEPASPGPRRP